MGSEWVKCTLPDGKTITFVNLAAAISITRRSQNTRIGFVGAALDAYVDVIETPEELFKRLDEAKRAERT
ncbi:hypothetical protein SAMN05444581_12725 [Methylocapsa palsarum]|uniref:Uncharacterized protein n=1 Tax=Methylocapsa palsarum TaxID=1612308 RepID=A0A1I4CS03_9HYPH|nr:hypothetical protein SAMN05444581_12725 [Methylocapsa palsarum]